MFRPTHPAAMLREIVIPSLEGGATELRERLGLSEPEFDAFIAERIETTPELAKRLGAAFGNSAEFWLAMQRNHDGRRC